MIKKFTITLLALIMGVVVMAQQESVSKQINQIKRNPLYIYSEATMATEEEAREVACEMLLKQVKEYAESKKYLVKADNILIKDIQTKSESLMMRRGTMYRVFVYVSKIDIEPVNNVTNINSSTGTTISTNNVVTKVTNAKPTVEQKQKEPETVKKKENVVSKKKKEDYFSKTKKVEPAVKSEPATVKSEPAVKSEPVVANEKKEINTTKEIETMNIHSGNLPKWQQQAIESLLTCANVSEIINKLNRLKAEYKISGYGTADKCRSVASSYWIIFDSDGRLVTILGMGETERLDYSSAQTSSLEKYRGMNALWFNFAK
ncbi:MAG: hypothetical protein J6V54_08055 [Bacteroidales bacterium]|nr:hypothetical protein [Bacteroidales bacterium]